ncbi:MAG: hypothetical protein HPY66_3137 [Firmicutes bacterium]|nr:hypothetical protein [Bacillota bacterium]
MGENGFAFFDTNPCTVNVPPVNNALRRFHPNLCRAFMR